MNSILAWATSKLQEVWPRDPLKAKALTVGLVFVLVLSIMVSRIW